MDLLPGMHAEESNLCYLYIDTVYVIKRQHSMVEKWTVEWSELFTVK